jgi:adenosylcobinamide-GDP ribazoletransferase
MPVAEAGRGAAAAVAFLTRLPVGRAIRIDGSDIARGAAFFPLVGAAIGAAAGGTAEALARVVPAIAAGAVGVGVAAALTGALHLDALADTADALTAKGERALEIMRDHAIGSYGAVALGIDLLVKAAALAALAAHHRAIAPAVAAVALSRAVPVTLGATLPSIRSDGAGAAFAGRISAFVCFSSVVIAVGIALAVLGLNGLELAGIVAVGALALAVWFLRWLGGVTGDLLGASVEMTETLALLSAAALLGAR